MKVFFFGKLRQITKADKFEIDAGVVKNVNNLKRFLFEKFPGLRGEVFTVAVNRKIVGDDDIELREEDEVALLPPFSGG